MTALEFAEWYAYAHIQPFGEARDDQRAGAIASAIVNVNLKKGSKARTWRDFFPRYEDRAAPRDWRDLLAKVVGLNEQLGGADRRKHKPGDH